MTTSKTLEEIISSAMENIVLCFFPDASTNLQEVIKSACLEYSEAQDAKIAELQTKLTKTNERLMARELLLTQQHDDLVKLESRVRELEADGKRLDKLQNDLLIGCFGPCRESEDHHPIKTHTFDAPEYDNDEGGIRKMIDEATPFGEAQQPKEHHEGT